MARERTLGSYIIRRNNLSMQIQAGDYVLMQPPHPLVPMYVAKIRKITSNTTETEVKVRIQWYYRPEDTILGRQRFHGIKELFLSDHYDIQSVDTIERKCTVYTFEIYTSLEVADEDDFFCRFQYSTSTAEIRPKRVPVFHPSCIDMTEEEALLMGHFFCQSCLASERRILHP